MRRLAAAVAVWAALSGVAQADAGLTKVGSAVDVWRLLPAAARAFCREYWPLCAARAVGGNADPGLLEAVNRAVNAGIVYRREAVDRWTVWPAAGDCDDYAVTKLSELIDAGVPRDALRLALVTTAAGEGHMVLLARTDGGDVVLDNRTDAVVRWDRAGYRWVAAEWNNRGLDIGWRLVR